MRNGLLGSLAALLAGAGLICAEPPAVVEQTGAAETKANASPAPPPPDPSRSPYWPNPLALLDCAPPAVPIPEAGCAGGAPLAQGELFWANAEYLLWWVRNGPLPTPLVTTGSATSLGRLHTDNTVILEGGSDLDFHAFSGARFGVGFWFDRGCNLGIEGSGFFLETRTDDFSVRSSAAGNPVLARPVINSTTGTEDVELVARAGQFAGGIAVNTSSTLYGWELNGVSRVHKDGALKVDMLAGFRAARLDEDINIIQDSSLLPGGTAFFARTPLAPPATLGILDHFSTFNSFYGGQIGTRVEFGGQRLFVNFVGKIAIGTVHEVVQIAGATSLLTPGAPPTTVRGGVLALPSNIGRDSNNEFGVLPELSFNVGYWITPLIRAYVGYTWLYLNDVARPGDQISRTINPALLPTSQSFGTPGGLPLPAAILHRTDFWAQGVNFGLEFRY
jgi:hypothetical protein